MMTFIKRFYKWQIFLETRSFGIGNGNRFEMALHPRLGPIDTYILNRYALRYSLAMDWNGKPLFTLMSLDLITIAPAMFIILNIIIENKQICSSNLVEISTPGNIRGLQDNNVH